MLPKDGTGKLPCLHFVPDRPMRAGSRVRVAIDYEVPVEGKQRLIPVDVQVLRIEDPMTGEVWVCGQPGEVFPRNNNRKV